MRRTLRGCTARVAGLLALAAAIVWAPAPAAALTLRHMTMDEVVKKSDSIFLAVCEGKRTEFRAGNILTIYSLRPTEFWKGRIATSDRGTFDMEEVGGVMGQTVRLGQYVGGSAAIAAGEEVLLFTHAHQMSPKMAAAGAKQVFTPGNPEIVGRVCGRFSVLTEPATGEKYVFRPNFESSGIIPSDESIRTYLNSQQKALQAKTAGGLPPPTAASVLHMAKQAGVLQNKLEEARERSAEAAKSAVPGQIAEIQEFDKLASVRNMITTGVKALEGAK